jgi:hypothetical protein
MKTGWIIDCPDCRRETQGGQSLPIGIGMVLESRETAERLRQNHAGPQFAFAS